MSQWAKCFHTLNLYTTLQSKIWCFFLSSSVVVQNLEIYVCGSFSTWVVKVSYQFCSSKFEHVSLLPFFFFFSRFFFSEWVTLFLKTLLLIASMSFCVKLAINLSVLCIQLINAPVLLYFPQRLSRLFVHGEPLAIFHTFVFTIFFISCYSLSWFDILLLLYVALLIFFLMLFILHSAFIVVSFLHR